MSEDKATRKKIYCFNNGGSPGWYSALAIAEDGHCLAGHTCSHECYMRHDLGITSDWKHKNYNAHYGEGNWELVWIDDPKGDERLKRALELNQKLAKDAEKNSEQEAKP